MAGTSATVKESVMHPDIEQDCVDCAAYALQQPHLSEQRSLAQFIKKELDFKYGRYWHVIVGRFFGSHVSHDAKEYVYFFIGDVGFLCWRTEWAGKEVDIPSYPVTGRVLSALTQKPVFNARIECGGTAVQSSSTGQFTIHLIYGPKTILVSKKGLNDRSVDADVHRNGAVDIGDIVLGSTLQRRTGTVTNLANGAHLDRATVTVTPQSQAQGSSQSVQPVTSDAAGEFEFDAMPGTYDVVISRPGFFKNKQTVTITEAPEGQWASASLGTIALPPIPTCGFVSDIVGGKPRRYSILIDRSGSMSSGTRWPEAREALRLLSTAIVKLGLPFDVLMFDSQCSPKYDVKDVQDGLNFFEANGPRDSTDLALAVRNAVQQHEERGESTSILVITDGRPNDVNLALAAFRDGIARADSADRLRASVIGVGVDSGLESFLQTLEGMQVKHAGALDSIRGSQCGGETLISVIETLLQQQQQA